MADNHSNPLSPLLDHSLSQLYTHRNGPGEPARPTSHCSVDVTNGADPRELCPEDIEYYALNDARNREMQRRIQNGVQVAGSPNVCSHCFKEIRRGSPRLYGSGGYCGYCRGYEAQSNSASRCSSPLPINLELISNPLTRSIVAQRVRLVEHLEERCGQQFGMTEEERTQLRRELELLSSAHVQLPNIADQAVLQQLQVRLLRLRIESCFHQTTQEVRTELSMEGDRIDRLAEATEVIRDFTARASPVPSSAYSDFDSQAARPQEADSARVEIRIRDYPTCQQSMSRPTHLTNSTAQRLTNHVVRTNLDLKLNQIELAIIRANDGEHQCQLQAVARLRSSNNAVFGSRGGEIRVQERESSTSTATSSASVRTSVSQARQRRAELVREIEQRMEQQRQEANGVRSSVQRSVSPLCQYANRNPEMCPMSRASGHNNGHSMSSLDYLLQDEPDYPLHGWDNVLERIRAAQEFRLAQLTATREELARQISAPGAASLPEPHGTRVQRLDALFDRSGQIRPHQERIFEIAERLQLATDTIYSHLGQARPSQYPDIFSFRAQASQPGHAPNEAANTHPDEALEQDVSEIQRARSHCRAQETTTELRETEDP